MTRPFSGKKEIYMHFAMTQLCLMKVTRVSDSAHIRCYRNVSGYSLPLNLFIPSHWDSLLIMQAWEAIAIASFIGSDPCDVSSWIQQLHNFHVGKILFSMPPTLLSTSQNLSPRHKPKRHKSWCMSICGVAVASQLMWCMSLVILQCRFYIIKVLMPLHNVLECEWHACDKC